MKLRILIFLFFIPMMLVAQNMPKVVGVTFGWDYSKCKEILDRRFNAGEDSYQYEKNQLSYHGNIDFAGETFDYVVFYFQNDGFSTYLNKVTFVSRFDLSDADIAKKERERLFEVFKQKYEFRWSGKYPDGYLFYILGHDPFDYEDGFICIDVFKGAAGDGSMHLWTSVQYGPINFIDINDDI